MSHEHPLQRRENDCSSVSAGKSSKASSQVNARPVLRSPLGSTDKSNPTESATMVDSSAMGGRGSRFLCLLHCSCTSACCVAFQSWPHHGVMVSETAQDMCCLECPRPARRSKRMLFYSSGVLLIYRDWCHVCPLPQKCRSK